MDESQFNSLNHRLVHKAQLNKQALKCCALFFLSNFVVKFDPYFIYNHAIPFFTLNYTLHLN